MPTVLISGANRGIGKGFVEAFLAEGYQVIAAVRNKSAYSPPVGVITVQIESTSDIDALDAAKELQSVHGVTTIDVLIGNAGISIHPEFIDLSWSEIANVMDINVGGYLRLFQAFLPLMNPITGKVILMSSLYGCIEPEMHFQSQAAYGMSKAATNYLASRLNSDVKDKGGLLVYSLSPGWVQTHMGNQGAKWTGFGDAAPQTLEQVMPSILSNIASATRETHGGRFIDWDGKKITP